jgi:MFS transporter, DHA1 family, staphyloferrin A biosynthesis exporter
MAKFVNQAFAFRVRSFRIYMCGHFISSVGEWLDLVALNWMILQKTESALVLGLINACRLLPVFVMSFPAGFLSDRLERRNLLRGLQMGVLLSTLTLAFLCTWESSLWLIGAVVTLRSLLQAMDPPVRQSLLSDLVEREQLSSAIALHTAASNLSRILGPAVAGFLLTVMASESLLWMNAFAVGCEWVALALLCMKEETTNRQMLMQAGGFQEVASYLVGHKTILSLLWLAVMPMLFGFPYTSMLPLFTTFLFGLGSSGFGILLSISAVGAIVGSGWLSMREQSRKGRWLILSLIGFGLSLLAFMLAKEFITATIAMFFAGLCGQTYRTLSRITIQLEVPNALRGRVMSIALMDRGFISLGAMLIGFVASMWGVYGAGFLMGGGCVFAAILVLVVRREVWHL